MSENNETPLASVLLEEEDVPEISATRGGFLPIEANWFDRLFISVVIWIALSLFWFRFVEPLGLSIWVSNAISAVLAFIIIKKG